MNFEFRNDEGVKPSDFLPLAEQKKQKPTRLDFLYPGDRFVIVGLEESYKNLYLVSLSSCSAIVKGDIKPHEDEPFKSLSKGYSISLSTSVKRV